MSTLQVKNLPDELHERLRTRARAQRKTVSAVVIDALASELATPTTDEWLDEVRRLPRHPEIDVLAALDAARDEIEGR